MSMAWESPPVPSHGLDWSEVAAMLRSRPGEWLRVHDGIAMSVVGAVRQSSIRALRPIHIGGRPGGGFEVRTRNVNRETGTAVLYLRYVPEEGD